MCENFTVRKYSSYFCFRIEQVGGIAREQNFARFREQRFRKQSEDVNSRVMKWALAQVVLLIGLGLFQMKNLRKFFEAKKLV